MMCADRGGMVRILDITKANTQLPDFLQGAEFYHNHVNSTLFKMTFQLYYLSHLYTYYLQHYFLHVHYINALMKYISYKQI